MEAKFGAQAVLTNKEEAERIVGDARAVTFLARFYYHKLRAAEARARFKASGNNKHWNILVDQLKVSTEIFRKLTQLTEKTYESISDVPAITPERLKKCPYHWSDILPIFEKELAIYEEEIKLINDPYYHHAYIPGLAGIWYGDPGLKNAKGPDPVQTLNLDWTDRFSERERRWSARWFGFLYSPVSGNVTFSVAADQGVTFRLNNETIVSWETGSGERTEVVELKKREVYLLEVVYNHIDGKEAYLNIRWKVDKDFEPLSVEYLRHSIAQKREMERTVLLEDQ